MGEKLPLVPWKNTSNTKETHSNYNLLSSEPTENPYILQINFCDINEYTIGTFMYECLYGNIPDIFRSCFLRNADVHERNLRNANDSHVPYGRLDIKKIQYQHCRSEFVQFPSTVC